MYTRLFLAESQPGKSGQALQILRDFATKVKRRKGCLLNQVLQGDNQIVGITSWETQEDLAAYADSDLARELFRSILPLLMGMPKVGTYQVTCNLSDPAATKPV
jgi:quinol monooxygenase YgiN